MEAPKERSLGGGSTPPLPWRCTLPGLGTPGAQIRKSSVAAEDRHSDPAQAEGPGHTLVVPQPIPPHQTERMGTKLEWHLERERKGHRGIVPRPGEVYPEGVVVPQQNYGPAIHPHIHPNHGIPPVLSPRLIIDTS